MPALCLEDWLKKRYLAKQELVRNKTTYYVMNVMRVKSSTLPNHKHKDQLGPFYVEFAWPSFDWLGAPISSNCQKTWRSIVLFCVCLLFFTKRRNLMYSICQFNKKVKIVKPLSWNVLHMVYKKLSTQQLTNSQTFLGNSWDFVQSWY